MLYENRGYIAQAGQSVPKDPPQSGGNSSNLFAYDGATYRIVTGQRKNGGYSGQNFVHAIINEEEQTTIECYLWLLEAEGYKDAPAEAYQAFYDRYEWELSVQGRPDAVIGEPVMLEDGIHSYVPVTVTGTCSSNFVLKLKTGTKTTSMALNSLNIGLAEYLVLDENGTAAFRIPEARKFDLYYYYVDLGENYEGATMTAQLDGTTHGSIRQDSFTFYWHRWAGSDTARAYDLSIGERYARFVVYIFDDGPVSGSVSRTDGNHCSHSIVTVPGTEATCTENGLTEGRKCSTCGVFTVQQEVIPATGHSWTKDCCTVCGAKNDQGLVGYGRFVYDGATYRFVTGQRKNGGYSGQNFVNAIVKKEEQTTFDCYVWILEDQGFKDAPAEVYEAFHDWYQWELSVQEIPDAVVGEPVMLEDGIHFYVPITLTGACDGYVQLKIIDGETEINLKMSGLRVGLAEQLVLDEDGEAVFRIPEAREFDLYYYYVDLGENYEGATMTAQLDGTTHGSIRQDSFTFYWHRWAGSDTARAYDLSIGERYARFVMYIFDDGDVSGLVKRTDDFGCDHVETVIPGKAATCTEAGLTEGKKCTVCGTVTVEQKPIPAAGHKETVLTGKAATCTEAGLTEGKKCTVCGTVTVEQKPIPAAGHKETVLTGKAATCTEAGLTEGRKCTVCGLVLVKQEEIPALGHDWNCTRKNGALQAQCRRCGLQEKGNQATVSGKTVTVTLLDVQKIAKIWAASYDSKGSFVEIKMVEVTGETTTLTFDEAITGAVKVFFLTTEDCPWLDALKLS